MPRTFFNPDKKHMHFYGKCNRNPCFDYKESRKKIHDSVTKVKSKPNKMTKHWYYYLL